jgi:hypothetical protein
MKGVEPLIAAVFIIIISIAGIAIVLESSQPSIGRLKEISLLEEAKKILTQVDNAVRSVGEEGEGSTRVLQLSVSDGSYFIDTDKDAVIFYMDSRSQIVGIGVSKTEENINMLGGKNSVFLNVSYSNINITGGGRFGKGYHSIIIRNNGYDFVNEKQLISITLVPPILPPTAIIDHYNQIQTFVFEGTSSSPTNNLNDLGVNTYDIIEDLISGGQFNYHQASTKNITGSNTTSADYTNSLDNQNYNVTAKLTSMAKDDQYNQSETAIIKGTYFSGDESNLNFLGDNLFYDVQEDQDGTQENKLQLTPTTADRQSVDLTYGSCGVGSLGTNNNVYCGNTLGIDSNEWGYVNSTHSSNIPSDATITNVTICWSGYFETATNDRANDASYIRVGENSSGSWVYTNVASCIGTACNFYTDITRCYDVTSIINTVEKTSHVRISLYHYEQDDSNRDIFDDYNYVNITYTVPVYKVEVWHNSSSISYSGSLNSVNISLNFTATQTKSFSLQIYNWISSSWVSTNCNSGLVTANAWNMWWCNETVNPTNYISSDGIARVRISSETNEIQGILREDYVQYFISFSEPPQCNTVVEHNSSLISQQASSISVINITSTLKTNISASSFTFFVYNFTDNSWYNCQQSDIGSNYISLQCIITDPYNFVSQENNGIMSVRLESNSSSSYQMMEDYLVYQINVSKKYRMEVEHNSTGISWSGTLNSISILLNFSTNVSSSFNFMIYNFNSGSWETCDTLNPVANTWNTWWCNETLNPNYYNSTNGVIRFRLNETLHENLAEVKEDYVQYYVGYTP